MIIVNFRHNVNVIFSPSIVSSQDKYVTVAVQGGFLKVFYNIEGTLFNLTDPQDSLIKIADAQSKFVSESLYLFQLFLKKNVKIVPLSFIHLKCFLCFFFCFQLDVIFQLSKNEMLVRIGRQKMYTLSSKELNFTGRYFLGGVPEDEMPER